MGIFDKIKEGALNQFIEVIEWLDSTQDTIYTGFFTNTAISPHLQS
jgi:membrane protease subunit (stomatin/prohibitin family)